MAQSALRREKRRERASFWASLTPAQRLRRAARLTRAAKLLRAAGRASLVRDKAAKDPGGGGAASPFRELGEILAILKNLRVPHALIGGWAVIISGPFRTSDDLDLLAELSPASRKRLMEALAARYTAEWRPPGEDDPIAGLIRARPKDAGMPIDILAVKSGADRDVLNRARRVSAGNLVIPVARPEDLVAMKLQAGGGQDYVDAKSLLTLPEGLDEELLQAACRQRRVLDRLALIRAR